MRKFALIFLLLSLTSCNFQAAGINDPLQKAVYFVSRQGELSLQDLQAHPEIVAVHTFADFKKAASRKMALWIDRSATPFDSEQGEWINEAPQMYYPIVLIGTSEMLHAFRDLLNICCFSGPADYLGMDAPGFSVSQNDPDNVLRIDVARQSAKRLCQLREALSSIMVLVRGMTKSQPFNPFLTLPMPCWRENRHLRQPYRLFQFLPPHSSHPQFSIYKVKRSRYCWTVELVWKLFFDDKIALRFKYFFSASLP